MGYLGHVLMENRNGLASAATLTQATGAAERKACLELIEELGGNRRITLGVDKAYDVHDHVEPLLSQNVPPHFAQKNKNRKSVIDARRTRRSGDEVSMRKRKRGVEIFRWLKTVGVMRKTRQKEPSSRTGCLPSPWPPTIWCECETCCTRDSLEGGTPPFERAFATSAPKAELRTSPLVTHSAFIGPKATGEQRKAKHRTEFAQPDRLPGSVEVA